MSNIYKPYFYVIQDTITSMYYAGARWEKNCQKVDLFKGYDTSSNIIKKLIENSGRNRFVIRKIKVFNDRDSTIEYESKFLQKVDASNNPMFYNQHNNDGFYNNGSEEIISKISEKAKKQFVSNPQLRREASLRQKKRIKNKIGYQCCLICRREIDGLNFSRHYNSHLKMSKKWYTNGSNEILCYEYDIPIGWKRGRKPTSKETGRKISKAHTGKKRPAISKANTGKVRTKEQKKNYSNARKGKVWITNGYTTKYVCPENIPDGWIRGRKLV